MNALPLYVSILFFCVFTSCKKKDETKPDKDVTTGLHVKDGQYLADKCGNKIVLHGVNMGSVYAVNFGLKELEEIEKTGANTVRIILTQNYQDWQNGGKLTIVTGAKIEPIITSCLAKGMIPVLELHDFTGTTNVTNDLPKAIQWWTKPDVKSVLLKYQQSIIVNIANEPDNGAASDVTYRDANLTAIKNLRDAGYTCPIMIDAPYYGKDYVFFLYQGKALIDADPLHNLLFSVHAYWPTNGAFENYSDVKIRDNFKALKQSGLPIVLGELAAADIQNGLAYNINYRLLMKLCQENQFGYLAWWWGFYNNPDANNQLSMTNDGLYSGLQGAGFVIAYDDVNSISHTSKRACK
ncbi:glycoside hydrolase family 5 protein [Sphingobacterium sp. SRCM116780]|uniref:cellulase family glycosylhydrolase n=1 Tax=Sphingobacterium sp. SRCM116780 TaxID=2907623 RepID=UPI001F218E0F|nr:cellulase family glycosylhydrolase [Sphingobacterium sp. SRCM116780]UIR55636.1 glycoside hydrolase family 5 protein [Sphingobacterium sp. SRCM116780]